MIDHNKLARFLEQKICPEHHSNPVVSVEGGELKISACCDPFMESLQADLSKELDRQIGDSIKDVFGS